MGFFGPDIRVVLTANIKSFRGRSKERLKVIYAELFRRTSNIVHLYEEIEEFITKVAKTPALRSFRGSTKNEVISGAKGKENQVKSELKAIEGLTELFLNTLTNEMKLEDPRQKEFTQQEQQRLIEQSRQGRPPPV